MSVPFACTKKLRLMIKDINPQVANTFHLSWFYSSVCPFDEHVRFQLQ